MKPLSLKETALKEEMKERCLAKGQYIDENAKAKFDMLCHLEDFEVQYWELQKENQQLNDKINKAIDFYETYKQECVIGRTSDEKLIKDYYLPAQLSKDLIKILKEEYNAK